jgi:cytochrome c oxidase subunit III
MSERRSRGRTLVLLLAWVGALTGYMFARLRGVPAQTGMAAAPASMQPGEPGSGGYYAVWDRASQDGQVARHIGFQYAGMRHQADAALSGMWLFIATEILFFGGLFMLYVVYRSLHAHGFAEASRHAQLAIGTVNTALLITSSAVFSYGLGCAEQGRNRSLFRACVATALIGVAFIALKGYEWKLDIDDHLFPGAGFAITGADGGAAQLFWSFYFVATGLHGLHMLVGIGLVAWIAWHARAGAYSPGYFTPVEVVGLYWSFVDMVWLVLYPTIYLAGGGGP